MANFTYKGKSTAAILNTPLELGLPSAIEEYTGFSRELLTGERSLTRPIPLEYGTQYQEGVLFDIALWKENQEPFSDQEQRKINSWLTSPKYSDFVIFSPSEGAPVTYRGIFSEVKWIPASSGLIMAVCSFHNDSPYCWETTELHYEIQGQDSLSIYCDSDELEEYVYPTITVTTPHEETQVTITSITDHNNTMTIRAYDRLPMTFNCGLCIPMDATTEGIISYADLGWKDSGNIYWPRLLPGDNIWNITGDVQLDLLFHCPHKKVGGWL